MANTQLTTVQQLRQLTQNGSKVFGEFERIMKERTPQFLSSVITAVNNNTSLQACDPNHILKCAMDSASLGLDVNPNLGLASLVPYNRSFQQNGKWYKQTIPQFQIQWKGFVQLALRSGQYTALNVDVVFADEFKGKDIVTGKVKIESVEDGLRSKYVSSTDYDDAKKQGIVGIVFFFELVNGFQKVEYWTLETCRQHARAYSKSYQNDIHENKKASVWSTNFVAMAKKTVVKNTLNKFGPLSIEMAKAIETDQTAYNPDTGKMEYIDNEQVQESQKIAEKPKKGTQGLKSFIDASETQVEENVQEASQKPTETQETANAVESEGGEVIDNENLPF